jgi:hypothetical protein
MVGERTDMAEWRKIEDSLKKFREITSWPEDTLIEKQAFIAWLEFEVKTWRLGARKEESNG